MVDRPTVDRRTVLRTIGSSTAAAAALVSSVSATDTKRAGSDIGKHRESTIGCEDIPIVPESAANPPESYVSTVDRIVDGEHVVILLEDGTQTVGQIVVPAAEHPCLDENDRIVATVENDDLRCFRWLAE
ncbi:hypothetical protein EL22_02345 [Halostagnicola sp. A56]|uniref:hypothetical protein n=1 Tax=Halostagnicola sp. A56 TaxID=1495067 RepID=UPI00049F57DF|nr:hypothetical protein [Halostagnicola sp. A56]KDE58804.1 hypothetical protein EL22_02345 [Halostagnicola sp. A56]